MHCIAAIGVALPLLAAGVRVGHDHGHGHAHAELHRRVLVTTVVEVTETVYTTVTVDPVGLSSSTSSASATLEGSMTVELPEKGASTAVSTPTSSSTITQEPSGTEGSTYPSLIPEPNSAIVVNSCLHDIYVSSIGDKSCGPGTNCQLVPSNTTYREAIRVCDKSGISLKVSKTEDMTKPMQFEYTVWDDKKTVSYDISYLDCMAEKDGQKDMTGCVGYETGIQAKSGADCPTYKCVGNVVCAKQAYVVAEFDYQPGAPVGACNVNSGVAFELCAESRA
ncbi:hypothetical protein PTNB73_02495 [Pyrenophora teres f. teres]|nr:hypothetical protein HRS9122_00178 [Pyrenophora teres f. teres]KAE8873344.1 hypothetical protein PTNB73_02495 [Pyrenophora teres f. teres]